MPVAATDRKEASKIARQKAREERAENLRAMRNGDESKLPARDAGPVRRLARDVVDSRQSIAGYMFILVLATYVVWLILSIRPATRASTLTITVQEVILAMLAVVIGEGFYVGYKVRKLAVERFPGHSVKGVRLYAAMRNAQIRRWRMPRPKVTPGDKV